MGGMTVKLSQAKALLSVSKSLILKPERKEQQWQAAKDRNGKTVVWKFECRLRTAQTVPRGLWFRMQVSQPYPDTASIQLDCDFPFTKSHLPLYRLDLNPPTTHINGPKGPQHLAGMFIDAGVSHEHSYSFYHDDPDVDLKADQNPLADILKDRLIDFEQALTHACLGLNIDNRKDIPPVPLQGQLM